MTLAEQLQRFHAIVIGAAPLADGDALVEGERVPGSERMHVYAHAYTARIGSVIAGDYPKLAVQLDSLRALVPDYLRAYPPHDFSLREVGANLARFLAERGQPAHLVELARLERARVEAFDGGADVTPLRRAQLEALGVEGFPALRLELVPSSHVIELATNADDIWDAIESERPVPGVIESPRTVVVWRRDVTVIHRTLEPDEARVVPRLAAGTSFAAVCEVLADVADPVERALELLLRWLDAEILSDSTCKV